MLRKINEAKDYEKFNNMLDSNKLQEIKDDIEYSIILDFDGTLTEIRENPYHHILENDIRDVLIKLMKKYKLVAILTGRGKDAASKKINIPDLMIIGNMGLDMESEAFSEYIPHMSDIKHFILEEFKNEVKLIDDKKKSLAVHFPEHIDINIKEKIQANVENLKSNLDLTFIKGRGILEIRPDSNKGTAIKKIIQDYKLQKVIYVGDDFADEYAFRTLRDMKNQNQIQEGLSVLVYHHRTSELLKSVDFYLKNVEDVFQMLSKLTE